MDNVYGDLCDFKPVRQFGMPIFIENTPVLTCILLENRIVYSDPGFISTFVYTQKELLEMDFQQMIHPEYVPVFNSRLLSLKQEKSFEVQIKMINKLKQEIWLNMYGFTFAFQ